MRVGLIVAMAVAVVTMAATIAVAAPLAPEISKGPHEGLQVNPQAQGVSASITGPAHLALYATGTWHGGCTYNAEFYGLPLPYSWKFEMRFWNAGFDSYRVRSGNVTLSQYVSGDERVFDSGWGWSWTSPMTKYADIEARAKQAGYSYKTVCNGYEGCCWGSSAYVWTSVP